MLDLFIGLLDIEKNYQANVCFKLIFLVENVGCASRKGQIRGHKPSDWWKWNIIKYNGWKLRLELKNIHWFV
jgi:hypothetical protein